VDTTPNVAFASRSVDPTRTRNPREKENTTRGKNNAAYDKSLVRQLSPCRPMAYHSYCGRALQRSGATHRPGERLVERTTTFLKPTLLINLVSTPRSGLMGLLGKSSAQLAPRLELAEPDSLVP